MRTRVLSLLSILTLLGLLAAAPSSAETGPFRWHPGGGGGESGGWVLPKGAAFASPQYATGLLYTKDAEGNPQPVPNAEWQRIGDDLAMFVGSGLIAVNQQFFLDEVQQGTMLDANLQPAGTWERTGW